MLLPCVFVADGITTMFLMADVIAIMADGIAMYFCGRWNYHIVLMADVIAIHG